MPNGASATLSVLAQANIDGTFTNSASVTSTTVDLNPNNSANATVTVTANGEAILLKITRAGTTVILSWSTNAAGYSLQSKPNLSAGASWTAVTNVPVQIGSQFFVTNTIGTTSSFYRLVRTLPVLTVLQSDTKLVLSWPATASPSGTLKRTSDLISPIAWNTVTSSRVLIGNSSFVTNPLPTGPALYQLFY